MTDLADFLLARIAEDEAAVHVEATLRNDDPYWTSGEASVWERRQTPTRVLAECDAKRRIVEHYRYEIDEDYKRMPEGPLRPFRALRFLALPYADHPDAREEWKP